MRIKHFMQHKSVVRTKSVTKMSYLPLDTKNKLSHVAHFHPFRPIAGNKQTIVIILLY